MFFLENCSTYNPLNLLIQPEIIGFETARATFSSRRCTGRRNCKFNACFSILIFVIDAASLVFILSKHISMSEKHKMLPPKERTRSEKLFKFHVC